MFTRIFGNMHQVFKMTSLFTKGVVPGPSRNAVAILQLGVLRLQLFATDQHVIEPRWKNLQSWCQKH